MMETVSTIGMSVFSVPGSVAAGYPAPLLETGQTTCYHVGDDGDYELGVDKGYTVIATAGNTDIEVAHYAGNGISFTAPNTVSDAAAGLVTFLNTDRIRIKGSVLNDGEYNVLAGGVAGSFTTVENTIVNEVAGPYVTLYKVTAHSNNVVQDTKTGRMWSRYNSVGERVGEASIGWLCWQNTNFGSGRYFLWNVANTVSVIMPGNTFRITGGAGALARFHIGDVIQSNGYVNAVNYAIGYIVQSVAVNGADLDIIVDTGNQTMIAEGAVGDNVLLYCRNIFNYAAGANRASLAGYTDWRIPNALELVTLPNMEAPTDAPDAVAFLGWGVTAGCWTSTTVSGLTSSAKLGMFGDGQFTIYRHPKDVAQLICLVRG